MQYFDAGMRFSEWSSTAASKSIVPISVEVAHVYVAICMVIHARYFVTTLAEAPNFARVRIGLNCKKMRALVQSASPFVQSMLTYPQPLKW